MSNIDFSKRNKNSFEEEVYKRFVKPLPPPVSKRAAPKKAQKHQIEFPTILMFVSAGIFLVYGVLYFYQKVF